MLTQPIFYCNFHLPVTSVRGSNSRCTWKFGVKLFHHSVFSCCLWKVKSGTLAIFLLQLNFSCHHWKLGRATHTVQPIRNKEKVKNGFWLVQEKGEDIGERKAEIKTSHLPQAKEDCSPSVCFSTLKPCLILNGYIKNDQVQRHLSPFQFQAGLIWWDDSL